MQHTLKTENPYFTDLWDQIKTFEIRKEDDRIFAEGDTLVLKEFNKNKKEFTGRSIYCEVTYCLRNSEYVKEGLVCMGIREKARFPQSK